MKIGAESIPPTLTANGEYRVVEDDIVPVQEASPSQDGNRFPDLASLRIRWWIFREIAGHQDGGMPDAELELVVVHTQRAPLGVQDARPLCGIGVGNERNLVRLCAGNELPPRTELYDRLSVAIRP